MITVFLGQTKVNNIDLPGMYSTANEEVLGLDVTVNEGFGVDVFEARNELISEE